MRKRFEVKAAAFLAAVAAVCTVSSGAPAQTLDLLADKGVWLATGAYNWLEPAPGLFLIERRPAGRRLIAVSEEFNIHDHYRARGSARLMNYLYPGRMRIMD